MPVLVALMLQAISATPPERIDLTVPRLCAPSPTDGEILVCAERSAGQGPYRIKPLPPASSGMPKAELQLVEGLTATAETESHDVGGFPSKRAMIRLKIKF